MVQLFCYFKYERSDVMEFIGILCLILVSTTIASHLSRRIGIPAVVGQLLVGVLLGSAGLNWVQSSELVHEFSEIGVILLMFLAGLESDLALLRKYLKPSLLVATFGVAFPLVLGAISGTAFQIDFQESFFFGIILSATAVSITVEVLKEMNVMNTKEGSTTLGASVMDDVLVVLVLSLSIPILTGTSSNGVSLPILLLEQIAYFGLIFMLVKWIAPYLVELAEKLFANSAVIIVSLVICLAMAYLADFVGLSAVIGAFFAGVAVSQTKVQHEVMHNVEALGYSVFVPIFFVSIGLDVSFENFKSQMLFIIVFTLIAVISKLLGGFTGSKIAGFSTNSSWMVGAGMVARGEMALIVLQIGYQAGLIDPSYYSPFVIIILLSTVIAPLILEFFTKKVYP